MVRSSISIGTDQQAVEISSVEGKATAETMEEVGEQIEALQFKLDSISQNIVTQLETEKLHFQSK